MFKAVQLAEHIKTYKGVNRLFKGGYVVEPKINGLRGEIASDGIYSRYSNAWGFDTTKTEKLFNFLGLANIALDGEFDSLAYEADGTLVNHNDRRLLTASILKTNKIANENLDKLVYWVFDIIIPNNVFTLAERKNYLTSIMEALNKVSPFTIKFTPYIEVKSEKTFELALDYFMKNGFEGAMLKKLTATYKGKRTADWIAYKQRYTSDFPIVRVECGTKGKKNEFKMGSLVLKTPRGESEVGTGFNDEQREWFLKNKDKVRGVVVEVEHEGVSEKYGNLINVSFVRIRDDKPLWEISY